MMRGRRANAGNKYREFIAAIIPQSKPLHKKNSKGVQTSSVAVQPIVLKSVRKRVFTNVKPRTSISEIDTEVVHPKPKGKVMIYTSKSEIQHDFQHPQKVCGVCGKSVRSYNFARHLKIHTGEKPYSCDTCGKSFAFSTYVKVHKKIHTVVDSNIYLCEICGASTNSLAVHMLKHNKSKNYMKCECCLKWISKRGMKIHKRSHTGERPFQCRVCGKSFICSGKVKRHEKLHTGVLEYKCNVCGKMCSQKGNLKIHMRVHTHEKPYSCDLCGELFTYSTSLSAHKKKHQL